MDSSSGGKKQVVHQAAFFCRRRALSVYTFAIFVLYNIILQKANYFFMVASRLWAGYKAGGSVDAFCYRVVGNGPVAVTAQFLNRNHFL